MNGGSPKRGLEQANLLGDVIYRGPLREEAKDGPFQGVEETSLITKMTGLSARRTYLFLWNPYEARAAPYW